MRRIVVTGLGAVTPVGNDARSTWRAAVEGRSGIDFITAFDASAFPVRVAAEVKDFDPAGLASPKELRRLDRNVVFALAAGREAVGDAALDGAYDPARIGIVLGSAIGGISGIAEQGDVLRERGPDRVSPKLFSASTRNAVMRPPYAHRTRPVSAPRTRRSRGCRLRRGRESRD